MGLRPVFAVLAGLIFELAPPTLSAESPRSFTVGTDITQDRHNTTSVALGDVDGDGDLDLVAGTICCEFLNRLYLNNGTEDPFAGVSGTDITTDQNDTSSVALGDVDGDGDLDLVAGNCCGQPNLLYLNNGTANPFDGVSSIDLRMTPGGPPTHSVTLGDVDGDDDLDLVVGNDGVNLLYLNNGTGNPFNPFNGVTDITTDLDFTFSVVLGDVDGDGDLDLVAGNLTTLGVPSPNRLYLNNGTADPFNGVTGTDISADADFTRSVVLGDVDGDGDLDLVAGNSNAPSRLYLNNGTANPFESVSGTDLNPAPDIDFIDSVTLGDVDGDGDLDAVGAGNNRTNELYLNNGTANPFNGVSGTDITQDSQDTESVVLGDVDGDGDLDLVAGNHNGRNRLYLNSGTAALFKRILPAIFLLLD